MPIVTKSKPKQQTTRGKDLLKRNELLTELRQAVLTGRFLPGQVIPTESELMIKHQLSRHSVRTVLNTLVSEGLITRTPGRGTIVNPSAKRIKTRMISLIVQEPHEWLTSHIASGLTEVLKHKNCRLELIASGDTQQEFDQTIEDLLHNPTDGVIVMPLPWLTNHEWVFKLRQASIPAVTIDTYPTGTQISSVEMDNFLGGQLAARYLIQQGYRRLYFFAPKQPATTTNYRLEGFMQAATEKNSKVDICLILRYELTESAKREHRKPWIAAYEFWKNFIQNSEKLKFPIGIFTTSDIEAYGVLLACKELGIKVPEDIGIIGFDDRDLAILANPPLTTIRQEPKKMGQQAAELILAQLDNSNTEIKHIKIAPKLIERESAKRNVDCCPSADGLIVDRK